MHILLAPDSFKGSLSAAAAAQAMADGIAAVNTINARNAQNTQQPAQEQHTWDQCPVTDGGEGFVVTMAAALDLEIRTVTVQGPQTKQQVKAHWAMTAAGTAILEMAEAAGLLQIPVTDRNPMHTTTYGVGQLLDHARRQGAQSIIIGIGGSATNDGGAGMAQAIGYQFFTSAGEKIDHPITGMDLKRIYRIQEPESPGTLPVTVACDVTNPLTGPDGAAAVYGPQKGASTDEVMLLDAGLSNLLAVAAQDQHEQDEQPGWGAAGGLGFGLSFFCHGTLTSGVDLVLQHVGLDQRLAAADLCLTGEGSFDHQSAAGKVISGIAKRAQTAKVPVRVLAGTLGHTSTQALHDLGLAGCHDINQGLEKDLRSEIAYQRLADCVQQLIR